MGCLVPLEAFLADLVVHPIPQQHSARLGFAGVSHNSCLVQSPPVPVFWPTFSYNLSYDPMASVSRATAVAYKLKQEHGYISTPTGITSGPLSMMRSIVAGPPRPVQHVGLPAAAAAPSSQPAAAPAEPASAAPWHVPLGMSLHMHLRSLCFKP